MHVRLDTEKKLYLVRDVYIIASTNTDVPTHYGKWLSAAFDRGHVDVKLYANPRYAMRVSLRNFDVRGYVFYSKNYGPFLPILSKFGGRPVICIFTVGDAPALGARVPSLTSLCLQARELIRQLGSDRVIWKLPPLMFDAYGKLLFSADLLSAADGMVQSGIKLCLLELYSSRFHPEEMRARLRENGLKVISDYEESQCAESLDQLIRTLRTNHHLKILENSESLFPDFRVSDIEDRVNCVDIGRMTMPCPTQCLYCDTNYTLNYANDGKKRRTLNVSTEGLSRGLEACLEAKGVSLNCPSGESYSPYNVELRARFHLSDGRPALVNVIGDDSDQPRAYIE
jgi:hypothetical protein